MNKSFWLAGALALICALALGWYALGHPVAPEANLGTAAFPQISSSSNTPAASSMPLLPPRTAPAGSVEYRNTAYRFSLFYPKDLSQLLYDEGAGASTIVFQNPQEALGFQIFVVPYSGTQVSTAQFRKDEPSGVRENVSTVTIDGVSAASFYGQNVVLGDTAEVWFIHNGYLFEITAPKSEAAWLGQIMASWQFI